MYDSGGAAVRKNPIRGICPACCALASGAAKRLRARMTASPISRMGTSVRTAAGESSRTPRRAPAQRRTSTPLFDHLVRPEQDRLRDREAERLGGLEVDHELELCRLLDRQVAGLGAFEDFVNVGGRTAVQRGNVRAIGHEPADLRVL